MAESVVVSEADVTYGWVADVCGHEFRVGDTAIAMTIDGEHGPDPYGLEHMPAVVVSAVQDAWENHAVLSDWICEECFRLL